MTHYLTRQQSYFCDESGCLASFQRVGSARFVWGLARAAGWRTVYGSHLCSRHSGAKKTDSK